MQSSRSLLFALLLSLMALARAPEAAQPPRETPKPAPAASAAPELSRSRNACATCHIGLSERKLKQPAEQYLKSVHRDERIGCVGCHKGDPGDPTVQAHDKTTGFVPRPARESIADICGGCHENARVIRRFSAKLPVDQLALFRLSRHSQLASMGDDRAPTCSSCHGTHDILPVATRAAPVNRHNVADFCSKCHADKAAMAPYNARTDQFEQWKGSTHGKSFSAGNDSAPTCTDCHGAHAQTQSGAVTPGSVCSQCHEEQNELFLKSPHSKPFRKLGLSDCAPCHGRHEVTASSWLAGMSTDSSCSRCHARDEKPRQVAMQIAQVLDRVRQRLEHAKREVRLAQARGLFVPQAVYALEQGRTAELRLVTHVHSLDLRMLEEGTKAVYTSLDESQAHLEQAKADKRIERRGYYLALSIAVLLFGLLLAKAIQLSRRARRA